MEPLDELIKRLRELEEKRVHHVNSMQPAHALGVEHEIRALKDKIFPRLLDEIERLKDLIKNNQGNLELEREAWTKAVQKRDTALEECLDEVERLRKRDEITMGVGEGDGKMFVHGDYESIKHLQKKLFDYEAKDKALEECLEAFKEMIKQDKAMGWDNNIAKQILEKHGGRDG